MIRVACLLLDWLPSDWALWHHFDPTHFLSLEIRKLQKLMNLLDLMQSNRNENTNFFVQLDSSMLLNLWMHELPQCQHNRVNTFVGLRNLWPIKIIQHKTAITYKTSHAFKLLLKYQAQPKPYLSYRTARIRHQYWKTMVLSCHRCLINSSVEKMNYIWI
jgi:hypothetical protein